MSAHSTAIYPDSLAAMQTPGELYRPANGTEGDIFQGAFCSRCKRDVNDDCPIIAASMAFDTDEPEYPKEWQYGPDGQPTCTAFDPA